MRQYDFHVHKFAADFSLSKAIVSPSRFSSNLKQFLGCKSAKIELARETCLRPFIVSAEEKCKTVFIPQEKLISSGT